MRRLLFLKGAIHEPAPDEHGVLQCLPGRDSFVAMPVKPGFKLSQHEGVARQMSSRSGCESNAPAIVALDACNGRCVH